MSVREAILDLVISGAYGAGSRLTESELALRLNVSRTPIREALRQLEADGVVVIEKNKGARIIELDDDGVDALYRTRAELEPMVAGLSVPHLMKEDIVRLVEINEAMERDAERGDMVGVTANNNEFHSRLLEKCPNQSLRTAAQSLLRPLIVGRAFSDYSPEQVSRSIQHHREIVEAAETGDIELAVALLKAHILTGHHNIVHSR